MARDLASRNRLDNRSAQVRNRFIAREAGKPLPPLTWLLRACSKDAVHLRVLLSLLWIAGGGDGVNRRTGTRIAEPYSAAFYLDDMATLIGIGGLDASQVNRGRRRVAHSLARLNEWGFVRTGPTLGGPRSVQLRREDVPIQENATRTRKRSQPYFPPARKDPTTGKAEGSFVRMPATFWTKGWMAALPGKALALLLALRYLEETRAKSTSQRLFLADSLCDERFGFSEEVYYEGAAVLVQFGLLSDDVEKVRRPFSAGRRMTRTTFDLNWGRLDATP